MDGGIFLEGQRHAFAWLPSGPRDECVLTGWVVVLVRLDRREPVPFDTIRSAAGHDRIALRGTWTGDGARARGAHRGRRSKLSHAPRERIGEYRRKEQVSASLRDTVRRATRHEHAAVVRQQHRGMSMDRNAQLSAGGRERLQ